MIRRTHLFGRNLHRPLVVVLFWLLLRSFKELLNPPDTHTIWDQNHRGEHERNYGLYLASRTSRKMPMRNFKSTPPILLRIK